MRTLLILLLASLLPAAAQTFFAGLQLETNDLAVATPSLNAP